MMNRNELLQQIERWHTRDSDNRRIIDAIEALPERDYELTNLLARAYNNLAIMDDEGLPALEKAEELLKSVAAEGENDATWHYRLGYTLYFLTREKEALAHFQRALELNPDEEDALYFIDRCRRTLASRKQTALPAGEKEPSFHVTLNLNARLQPQHRHFLEDEMDKTLKALEIGEVNGGGMLMNPSGEVKSCDIEISLWMEDYIDHLMSMLDHLPLPKGSRLICPEERVFPVGHLEGLALRINGTDLPDQVYQDYDINYVMEQTEALLGDEGYLYSWWYGPQDTVLYYYGYSYQKMRAAILDFLAEYPLCQKCLVTQIA